MSCESTNLSQNNPVVITAQSIGKCYQIYQQPQDRLKQMLWRGRRQYFREFWALQNVSFEIKRGETIGIIGCNGSGKSTLLKLLCGALTATLGTLTTHGRIAALLELGTGFNPEFTGRENVYLNAAILGLDDAEITAYLPDILAFADIGEFIDQPVKTYSSGMVMRLAFAVAAHVRADVLIIDEALAVGDIFFVQKCMRFLRKFQEHGTLLFVSHDIAAVVNFCDRVLWLDHGQLRQLGAAKQVCEDYLALLRQASQANAEPVVSQPQDALPVDKTYISRQSVDQRLAQINQSQLRNDLELFTFNQESKGYGSGAMRITHVQFNDEQDRPLHWVIGGEFVTLAIAATVLSALHNPIIGFFIKDRLGQNLFGDNTYLTYAAKTRCMAVGQTLMAKFSFYMPILPVGDYLVDVAAASGTQQEHITHCWVNDALIIKSHASSVHQGLIGIPMHNIELTILDN